MKRHAAVEMRDLDEAKPSPLQGRWALGAAHEAAHARGYAALFAIRLRNFTPERSYY